MAANDVIQVTMEGKLHNQKILQVLHFITDDANGTPAGLAARVNALIVPTLLGVVSNEYSYIATWAQKIAPGFPEIAVRDAGAAGIGGQAVDSLPTSVAVVITKRTQWAGRAFRGRNYIAGLPETHEDNSTLGAAVQAAWDGLATKFGSATWAAEIYSPVIYHRSDKSFHFVTTCEARQPLRNQRRRQVGRGD